MSRRALAAGAIVALAVAGAVTLISSIGAAPSRTGDGLARIAFLDGVAGADVTLILHEAATGGAPRAVRDAAAIRAARARAYYSTDPATEAEAPGAAFVTILRNGAVESVYHCAPAPCPAESGRRDLAGLLEASRPLERITESFAHHDQARKRHWKLMNDPATVLIEPPRLPAPSSLVYPARVRLDLPTMLLAAGARPPDMAEYRARLMAAFAHAYPDTEGYRMGDITLTRSQVGDVILLAPSVPVEVIPGLKARLLGPAPFDRMPAFTPVLATPNPAIALPVPSVEAIAVTEIAPVAYSLTYYRIVPDEPSAQQ